MMKNFMCFIFTFILLLSNMLYVNADTWYPPEAPDMIKNASLGFINRGVVKIQANWIEDNEVIHNELGAGLSLGIRRNQVFIMTAGHVIKHQAHGRATTIKVSFSAAPRVTYIAEFIQVEPSNDFGVIALKISDINKNDLDRVVKLAVDREFYFGSGEGLSAIGHTLGKSWVVSGTSIQSVNGNSIKLNRKEITNGNSGGPILNKYNQMVGMVTSISGENAYALSINQVLEVLDNWNIPYRQQLSFGFVDNFLKIIHAVRENEDELLMDGGKKKYLYGFRKSNIALFDKKKAAWIYDSPHEKNQNFYVELIGEYTSNRDQFDEAWRIFVRAIAKNLPSEFESVKDNGYKVVFWYFKLFKGSIHVRIEEFSDRLYLIIVKNDHAKTDSQNVNIGLMYNYYSYMDDFLSDSYQE